MDKLKESLGPVYKYRFWIGCGSIVVLSTVMWFVAVSGLNAEEAKARSDIKLRYADIKGLGTKGTPTKGGSIRVHPNAKIHKETRDIISKMQTSVANHIGDIAKDHPDIAVTLVTQWIKEGGKHANWIARKALRHLIKQGHPGALKALGFQSGTKSVLSDFKLDKKKVKFLIPFSPYGWGP